MAALGSNALSPLTDAEDLVQLDRDHPGFRDPAYRARRSEIARIALAYVPGTPIPQITYTTREQGVWQKVWEKLSPLHEKLACRGYLESCALLALDHRRIPQLSEVNATLAPRTGFQMLPVAGLIASRTFLGKMGQSIFLATQYIRHQSQPLYTPEPDVVHELVGHAASLCDPALARLNRLFGQAAERATDAEITWLERLYWYTVEFGLVEEKGGIRAFGAGLLSSFGELGRFETEASLRPFDPEEAAARPYDPTTYQAVLYVAPSFDALATQLEAWFTRRLAR